MITAKDAYEDCADMMMGTLAVQLGGASRAQVLAGLKAKFQTEADLVAFVQAMEMQANAMLEQAKSKLKPGQTLGIAYPLHPASGSTLH